MNSRKSRYVAVLGWLLMSAFLSTHVRAQGAAALAGDFAGNLGQLSLKLHLHAAPDGTLSGTIDSPKQGAMGLVCSEFKLEGTQLSFQVPSVRGSWKGSIEDGGATLAGTWTQVNSKPLKFVRDTFVPAAKPSPVDGFWLGTLHADTQSLRIQITVKSDQSGHEFCTVDSLDQEAFGLQCANVVHSGADFSFEVPSVKASWAGKLAADGQSLSGHWTQRRSLPLDFARQKEAQAAPPIPPATYDPAIAPVEVSEMQAVLTRDLARALKSGMLAPGSSTGVSVGVLRGGVRRVFSYGTAKPDSIFEIGSVTKTFTGLVLAQMIEQGKVKLETPVRELLPPGTVAKAEDHEITLLDLVTQHSGLARMPDNFAPADPNNPYADYHAAELYQFIKQHGLVKPADATFLYSNLGFGLLGQALSNRAAMPYPQLLKEQITVPLGLKDTVVTLTPQQQSRFIPGHNAQHEQVHEWNLDALGGAGAIRSTADDLLTYLQANLHPESVNTSASANARTLPKAIALSHEVRNTALPGMHIAFAWLREDAKGTYWHNGGTGGYSSFVFFNPQFDFAAVVLVNETLGRTGSFADRIGQHLAQRFAGKPALTLE